MRDASLNAKGKVMRKEDLHKRVIVGGGKKRAQQDVCVMSVSEDELLPETPWFQSKGCYCRCYMDAAPANLPGFPPPFVTFIYVLFYFMLL